MLLYCSASAPQYVEVRNAPHFFYDFRLLNAAVPVRNYFFLLLCIAFNVGTPVRHDFVCGNSKRALVAIVPDDRMMRNEKGATIERFDEWMLRRQAADTIRSKISEIQTLRIDELCIKGDNSTHKG